MFAVIPHLIPNVKNKAPIVLPGTWNYSYTYQSRKYTEAFIGTDPATASSETVPIYLIPLKLTYKASGKKTGRRRDEDHPEYRSFADLQHRL